MAGRRDPLAGYEPNPTRAGTTALFGAWPETGGAVLGLATARSGSGPSGPAPSGPSGGETSLSWAAGSEGLYQGVVRPVARFPPEPREAPAEEEGGGAARQANAEEEVLRTPSPRAMTPHWADTVVQGDLESGHHAVALSGSGSRFPTTVSWGGSAPQSGPPRSAAEVDGFTLAGAETYVAGGAPNAT